MPKINGDNFVSKSDLFMPNSNINKYKKKSTKYKLLIKLTRGINK